jgi:hypothetical protein
VLRGDKGLKEVKVGFIPAGARRAAYFNLSVGEQACYFLTPHPIESFFVLPMYFDREVNRREADFARQVELVKRCSRLLNDPDAGLKAKDAEDRLLTAAMLIVRYRTRPPGSKGTTEPVPAEMSRRILETLAEARWDGDGSPALAGMGPRELFFRLGLKAEDGWKTPGDLGAVAGAAKKWIKENAGKYRIQRFVAEAKK